MGNARDYGHMVLHCLADGEGIPEAIGSEHRVRLP